ncbi:30S ribosomal protein S16 [Candidatus Saccharibacteria bacterium]|nr:MAG: 30S ribosomal protein S16 [Candidatus Saccharibacteria bacterium]
MLVIRLQRVGRKGHAQFRVVVQDSRRTPTSGKIVAQLGTYDPHSKNVILSKEKATHYLEHGAQPSPRVALLLKAEGVKLPAWVKLADKKVKGTIRHFPEKLRRNRPAEPKAEPKEEVKAEEAPAEETAEALKHQPQRLKPLRHLLKSLKINQPSRFFGPSSTTHQGLSNDWPLVIGHYPAIWICYCSDPHPLLSCHLERSRKISMILTPKRSLHEACPALDAGSG